MEFARLLCKIATVVAIYTVIYNITKDNFYRIDERFDRLVGYISKRYTEKIIKESEKTYLRTGKETLIDKLENTIFNSGIRRTVPFFSAKMVVVISMGLGASLAGIVLLIKPNNPALIIEIMILGVSLPNLILQDMSIRMFNQIDKDLDVFTIKGISHSKSKSTLVVILDKCEEYLTGPIKSILGKLVNDLNRGIQREVAFNSAIESTENIRLKQLLTNLLVASKNEANYKKVFKDAEEVNKDYFEIKDMAKDKIREGKSAMAGLAVAAFGAVWALNRNFPNMTHILNDTMFGQIIIAYFGAVIIFLIYKFFSFNKINY